MLRGSSPIHWSSAWRPHSGLVKEADSPGGYGRGSKPRNCASDSGRPWRLHGGIDAFSSSYFHELRPSGVGVDPLCSAVIAAGSPKGPARSAISERVLRRNGYDRYLPISATPAPIAPTCYPGSHARRIAHAQIPTAKVDSLGKR